MVRKTTHGRGRGGPTQSSRNSNPRNATMIEPRGPDVTHRMLSPMYKCNMSGEELSRHLGAKAILRLNFAFDVFLV